MEIINEGAPTLLSRLLPTVESCETEIEVTTRDELNRRDRRYKSPTEVEAIVRSRRNPNLLQPKDLPYRQKPGLSADLKALMERNRLIDLERRKQRTRRTTET